MVTEHGCGIVDDVDEDVEVDVELDVELVDVEVLRAVVDVLVDVDVDVELVEVELLRTVVDVLVDVDDVVDIGAKFAIRTPLLAAYAVIPGATELLTLTPPRVVQSTNVYPEGASA
jgi:hypothetical protein